MEGGTLARLLQRLGRDKKIADWLMSHFHHCRLVISETRWTAWLILQSLQNRLEHFFVFAKTRKPLSTRFASEPGQLTLRIMAHVEFCLLNRTLKVAFAFEIFNNAPVAVGAERI